MLCNINHNNTAYYLMLCFLTKKSKIFDRHITKHKIYNINII